MSWLQDVRAELTGFLYDHVLPILDDKQKRRERIATAALQGLLASDWAHAGQHGQGETMLSGFAVACADALIAALDAEPGKGEK